MRNSIIRLTILLFLLQLCSVAHASENARQWLASMSVEQKVGQLFTVFFQGPTLDSELKDFIDQHHIGGVILYSIADNVHTPEQVTRLTTTVQRYALANGSPGLFVSIDQEGGPVARLRRGFAVPPSNMTVGASGDPALAGLAARITADQLKAVGINMNFAPSVDVNSNPSNPIIGIRSYGGTPQAVGRFGAAAISEYVQADIIPVAKHFPGHGDTGYDSHLRLPIVPHSRQRLNAVELQPFKSAIQAGVPAIMTAHVEVPALEPEPGRPATMSRAILTDLLRTQWGFDGLIVTDSMSMGAITEHYGIANAGLNAFQAGADVLLYGADKGHRPKDFIPAWERILSAVQNGEISMQHLDASVLRILQAKERFGILSPSLPDPAVAKDLVGTPIQQADARRIAEAGLTLLRDVGGLLPLSTENAILYLWPNAKAPYFRNVQRHEGMQFMALPKNPEPEHIALALQAAKRFDTVVVMTSRALKHTGQKELLDALGHSELARHTIMVSLDTPYDILVAPEINTCIAAYSNVPASISAITDALYGRCRLNGQVPVEIPLVMDE